MRRMTAIISCIAVSGFFVFAGVTSAKLRHGTTTTTPVCTGGCSSKDARISLETARRIAKQAFAGIIVSQELERERGGSGLRYSFDIRKNGITREVGVDAKTGGILENSREGPGSD